MQNTLSAAFVFFSTSIFKFQSYKLQYKYNYKRGNMRISGNNNFELALKMIAVIVACEVLVFMAICSRGASTYKLHKKDYVLVKGTVEDTVRYIVRGRYRHDFSYTIIKVTEFDGTVYKVKATRRPQDKIGETVIIAINPLDDKKNIIKGVWTRAFCPDRIMETEFIYFVLPILIIPIVISGKRGDGKDSFRKF